MRLRCPHCGAKANIRTSRVVTDTLTEMYVQCMNVECAHTWKAHTLVVHSIAPSMTPRKGLAIPFVPRHQRTDLVGESVNQIALPGMDSMPNPRAMSPDTG